MQEPLDLQSPERERPVQRVVVTGGASDIGLAVARAFWNDGARVHIGDDSAQRVAEVLGEYPGLHGSVTDCSSSSDVEELFSEALGWMDGLDVFVHCAGDRGTRRALWDLEPEAFAENLNANLTGAFRCLRQAARVLRPKRAGAIINVASTAARTGMPGRSAYVASMAGLVALSSNAARELGPENIRCNVVLPGMIDDAESQKLVRARARKNGQTSDEAEAEVLRHVSMRTWISASDVAEAVLFLASDAASHITGQALGVCGNLEWE